MVAFWPAFLWLYIWQGTSGIALPQMGGLRTQTRLLMFVNILAACPCPTLDVRPHRQQNCAPVANVTVTMALSNNSKVRAKRVRSTEEPPPPLPPNRLQSDGVLSSGKSHKEYINFKYTWDFPNQSTLLTAPHLQHCEWVVKQHELHCHCQPSCWIYAPSAQAMHAPAVASRVILRWLAEFLYSHSK